VDTLVKCERLKSEFESGIKSVQVKARLSYVCCVMTMAADLLSVEGRLSCRIYFKFEQKKQRMAFFEFL
jgi:hypothetical protein